MAKHFALIIKLLWENFLFSRVRFPVTVKNGSTSSQLMGMHELLLSYKGKCSHYAAAN